MKRVLALLLALAMCVALFAACSKEKEKPSTPDNTPPQDNTPTKPDDPSTPSDPVDVGPALPTLGIQEDGVTFIGILDATDDYSMVIENQGAYREDRLGVYADAGTVQIAAYNKGGTRRAPVYSIDWASAGLDGAPYEYLGATFVLDISDPNAPKIKETSGKTTECILYADIVIGTDNGKATYTLPDGKVFGTGQTIWCGATGHVINDSSVYIPRWNDVSNAAEIFSGSFGSYGTNNTADYYLFIQIPALNMTAYVKINDAPSGYTGKLSPNDAAALEG